MEPTSNTYFLARHGSTDYNDQDLLMGRMDIPLNAKGKLQAIELGQELQETPIDLVYCSPLIRARETARIALEQLPANAPRIFCNDALVERSMGKLEGLPKTQLQSVFPDFGGKNILLEFDLIPPGGESFMEMAQRVEEFLQSLGKIHQGKRILLLSHFGPLRVALKYFYGIDWSDSIPLLRPNGRLISVPHA